MRILVAPHPHQHLVLSEIWILALLIRDVVCVCALRLFVTLWTVCQAPQSMGPCRQEYWSGLPFPPPGDLPDPRNYPDLGTEPASPVSPALQADCLPAEA